MTLRVDGAEVRRIASDTHGLAQEIAAVQVGQPKGTGRSADACASVVEGLLKSIKRTGNSVEYVASSLNIAVNVFDATDTAHYHRFSSTHVEHP